MVGKKKKKKMQLVVGTKRICTTNMLPNLYRLFPSNQTFIEHLSTMLESEVVDVLYKRDNPELLFSQKLSAVESHP